MSIVTLVSPAKMAQPIEMSFGIMTRVGPRNHVLDGNANPQGGEVVVEQKWRLVVK